MITKLRMWSTVWLKLTALDWLAPLLMRLYFGYFWVETGWAKIQNLDSFTQHFVEWGIPYPHLSAVLSGYTEWIGGILLMLGLMTRLVSIPLLFNMVVAVFQVKWKEIVGIDGFVETDEVLYLFIFFWFLMAGPGRASVDHLVWRWIDRKTG